MNKKRDLIKILAVIAVMILISVLGYFFIKKSMIGSEDFRNFVSDHLLIGSLVFMLICILQVVAAFIPGEFIEIAAGYLFGAWYGSIIALIGTTIGSCLVIIIVRKYGKSYAEKFYSGSKLNSHKFFHNKSERNFLTALLFFIPGTPKDLFTYIIGFTDMRISTYLLLTTVARYPSIVSSCLGGDALGTSRFLKALVILSITAVISVLGVAIYKVILYIKGRK